MLTEGKDGVFEEGSLKQLFWQEQFKAAKVSNKRQIRWHPLIIKWCLALKLVICSLQSNEGHRIYLFTVREDPA